MSYYTAIMIMCWLVLAGLCILVRENNRLGGEDRKSFYLSYGLIAVSALAEWVGVQLNGRADLPEWPLMAAKCADYIFTPLAAMAFIEPLRIRNKLHHVLAAILAANTLLQVVSVFTGWMITIGGDGRYSHGPLYPVYMTVYFAALVIIVIEFILYSRAYSRRNSVSLFAVLVLILVGIILQEAVGGEVRTAYITLAVCAALLFIRLSEFSQLESDEQIQEQERQITTDVLTGGLNRFAYTQDLKALETMEQLPGDLVIFSIDLNGLKNANDTMGHDAGDELICGAARCIEKVFGEWGRCFRTGGDEFMVIAYMDKAQIRQALEDLQRETAAWTGEQVKSLRLSAGCAALEDHPGLPPAELAVKADEAMYEEKAAYYRETGLDRRHTR